MLRRRFPSSSSTSSSSSKFISFIFVPSSSCLRFCSASAAAVSVDLFECSNPKNINTNNNNNIENSSLKSVSTTSVTPDSTTTAIGSTSTAKLVAVPSVWNPLSKRMCSLQTLRNLGFDQDSKNDYRISVEKPDLVYRFVQKSRLLQEQKPEKLKKWEKQLLLFLDEKVPVISQQQKQEPQEENEQKKDGEQDQQQHQQQQQRVKEEEQNKVVTFVSEFINQAFNNAVRGESKKLKTVVEPDTLTFDQLTPEQQRVVELVTKHPSKNFYLGGSGGSGKSMLIRSLHATLVEKQKLRVCVAAATGLAATIIGGSTLHSLLGISPSSSSSSSSLSSSTSSMMDIQTLRACDVLIVDESSMLTSSLLFAIDTFAKEARLNSAPFGGIQVILSGDQMQFVPNEENSLIIDSPIFQQHFVKLALKSFCRHRGDDPEQMAFREALRALRVGQKELHPVLASRIVDAQVLEEALSQKNNNNNEKADIDVDDTKSVSENDISSSSSSVIRHHSVETEDGDDDAVFLFPRRISAERVNELCMQRLPLRNPEQDEMTFIPARGVISLNGNFTSACVVAVSPSKAKKFDPQDFAQRLSETFHQMQQKSSQQNEKEGSNKKEEEEQEEAEDNEQTQDQKVNEEKQEEVEPKQQLQEENNNNNNKLEGKPVADQQEENSVVAAVEDGKKEEKQEAKKKEEESVVELLPTLQVMSTICRSPFGLTAYMFRLRLPDTVSKEDQSQMEQVWQLTISEKLKSEIGQNSCEVSFQNGNCSDLLSLDAVARLGIGSSSSYSSSSSSPYSMVLGSNNNALSTGNNNNGTNNSHYLQPLTLRVGAPVMVNRNLTKEIVNGSLGVLVGFEDPDPSKFPFSSDSTLMSMWSRKGGKAALKSFDKLPLVRFALRNRNTSPQQEEAKQEVGIETKDQEQEGEEEVRENQDPSSSSSSSNSSSSSSHSFVEYQIPPMFQTLSRGVANLSSSSSSSSSPETGNNNNSYDLAEWYSQSAFQVSLIPAAALTCAKSQGLTIRAPKKVFIDFRELWTNAQHLVYVAASRVERAEQLFLVGLKPEHIVVNKKCLEFTESLPSAFEIDLMNPEQQQVEKVEQEDEKEKVQEQKTHEEEKLESKSESILEK